MKSLVDRLNKIAYDLRAEAIVADLIRQGVDRQSISVQFESDHKSNWNNDILKYDYAGDKLVLKLSRNGLFHSLPEYLFLKPLEVGVHEMSEILEFNKRQESRLKILFNPIENEIFGKRVELEEVGDDLFASLTTYDNESLIKFWMIDNQLDKKDQAKFCKIIPLLHSIVGDFPLTAKCLEYLLEEPVTWMVKSKELSLDKNKMKDSSDAGLGDYSCGDNMVMNGTMTENVQSIEFSIGPLAGDTLKDYLDNGAKHKLIELFTGYFIPLHYEFEMKLVVSADDSCLILDNSFMGLDTVINSQ